MSTESTDCIYEYELEIYNETKCLNCEHYIPIVYFCTRLQNLQALATPVIDFCFIQNAELHCVSMSWCQSTDASKFFLFVFLDNRNYTTEPLI